MGIFGDLLTLPVLGAPRLVVWLAKAVGERAEAELLDEEPVRSQLLDLQERYEIGDMTEDEYERQETALLERLNNIREWKERRGDQR
ncbi:MAG: gas vesicle [Dehalococcoidia bacterium]|nr:gas vesicle [Dehalococcoidia bacterium]